MLKTFFANKWVVGAGTYGKGHTNLVPGHAYAVLGAYEI